MNDTVKHNGMDQPFLISRKLRLLVGVATTSTESYFLLEVWKQLKNNMTSNSTTSSYHIARRVGHQGARPPVGCQAGIEKNATGQNISKDCRLLKCRKKRLVQVMPRGSLQQKQQREWATTPKLHVKMQSQTAEHQF